MKWADLHESTPLKTVGKKQVNLSGHGFFFFYNYEIENRVNQIKYKNEFL